MLPDFLGGGLGSLSRRVSFRVSLRWQNPKTDANRQKPTKELENAKWLVPRGLRENRPSLLVFRETDLRNPSLSDPPFVRFFLSISQEINETRILSALLPSCAEMLGNPLIP